MASTDVSGTDHELKQATEIEPSKEDHSDDAVEKKEDNEDDIVLVDMADVPRDDNTGNASAEAAGTVKSENTSNETDKKKDIAGAGDLATRENTSEVAAESPVRGVNSDTVSDKTESGADGSGDTSKTDSKSEGEDEWEDVLGNSLLRKKVNKAGEGRGTRPVIGSVVTIKTKTVLLDETEVDVHDNFKFVLGDGDVLQALDLCVALMELHEEAVIATGYKYAWGELGRKPDIPPKADLMIFVELLQVDPPPDYSAMEVPERIKEADAKRERGNFLYRRSEYSLALNSYTKGLQIVDPENGYSDKPEILQQLLELRVKLLCNTAACQNKLTAHDAAIKSCEEALKLQPTNTKALYRCGKAHEGKGDKSTAVRYLKLSLKHDETNSKMVHAELAKLTKELKRESEKEKQIYQKMFGGPAVKKKQDRHLALQGSLKSESRKTHPSHLTQDDLEIATGAVSPRTKTAQQDDSGSGAQSAMKTDPEKDLKEKLIHFLYNFGIVIDENDPYANLHIQTAVSELVEVLETVNQPEARRFMNGPKPRNAVLEKTLNEFTADTFDVAPRKARNTHFSNTTMKLRQEIKDGNGNAKLSFTGDALHEMGDKDVDSDLGSSVDSEEFDMQHKRKQRGNWLLAAAGGAVAAAAVSFGVYRYMNH